MKRPFEYYKKETQIHVNREHYVTRYMYSRGKCIAEVVGNTFVRGDYPPEALVEKVLDEEAFRQAKAEAAKLRSDLHEEFKQDLFETFCVEDNPKREQLFQLAWEYGHSSGHEEVHNHFCEMVDLIR